MRKVLPSLLGAMLTLLSVAAWSQANRQAAAPLAFRDAAEEARFHALAAELRCVMCQNQSLADSNALIALELRREVLDLMQQGKDDRAIKAFLVQRYGDFVLYQPKVEGRTWLLWLGPFVLLIGGAGVVASLARRRRATTPLPADDGQEW